MKRNKANDVDDHATVNLFGMEKGCAAPAARDIVMMMCSFLRSFVHRCCKFKRRKERKERVKAASLTQGSNVGARKSGHPGWLER